MIDRHEHGNALCQMRHIELDCGLWDELNFQIGARILSRKHNRWGIHHDFELFDDGYVNVSYRYDISLPRLAEAMTASGDRS
jgi:hypothetical protein